MRRIAAQRSSLDAPDQWGVEFPLLPEDLAELVGPRPSSLAQAISSWRLSIPTLLPRRGDALDQWGIEFPIASDELTAFGANRPSGCLQARTAAILDGCLSRISRADLDGRLSRISRAGLDGRLRGISRAGLDDRLRGISRAGLDGRLRGISRAGLDDRLRGISRAGAWAAILAVMVAGSASAVPTTSSAGAPPARTGPVVVIGVDSAEIASLASITEQPSATSNPTPAPTPGATSPAEQPSATSNPTPEPTPGATSPAEAIGAAQAPNNPAPAVLGVPAVPVESTALPTIQDARNYLVARLGTRVDRPWGRSQSQCASLIFEYESTWNPHATNKKSGAYGLPQAFPASRLANWAEAKAAAAAKAGDAETARLYRAWRDNPVVQAEWGVDYMIDRYGSPCAALAFRNEVGWY